MNQNFKATNLPKTLRDLYKNWTQNGTSAPNPMH